MDLSQHTTRKQTGNTQWERLNYFSKGQGEPRMEWLPTVSSLVRVSGYVSVVRQGHHHPNP